MVLLITITLVILLIASYTDIKTREVPDWINFSLIASALGIRIIFAIHNGFEVLLSGLIGFAIAFGLAFLFYYTNQWGGGDSKLLMGMGAVIGISYPFTKFSLTLFWFFLSLLFLGAIWGLLWMIGVAIRKKHLFIVRLKSSFVKNKLFHLLTWLITMAFVGLAIFQPLFWSLTVFPPIIFYLLIFVNSVEKSCFFVRKKPKELTEGDWLAESIVINGKKIMSKRTLTKKDLVILNKNKKINTVMIKEGIPFIPSFLFAYLTITFFGNYINTILRSLF